VSLGITATSLSRATDVNVLHDLKETLIDTHISFPVGRVHRLGIPQDRIATRLAFINADWRDFQNTQALEEKYKGGILIDDYLDILKRTGWYHTHIIQAPMSSQRFSPVVVSAMQKKGILGITSRYVIILNQQGLY
jgi:hypothetical protein